MDTEGMYVWYTSVTRFISCKKQRKKCLREPLTNSMSQWINELSVLIVYPPKSVSIYSSDYLSECAWMPIWIFAFCNNFPWFIANLQIPGVSRFSFPRLDLLIYEPSSCGIGTIILLISSPECCQIRPNSKVVSCFFFERFEIPSNSLKVCRGLLTQKLLVTLEPVHLDHAWLWMANAMQVSGGLIEFVRKMYCLGSLSFLPSLLPHPCNYRLSNYIKKQIKQVGCQTGPQVGMMHGFHLFL